MSSFIKREFKTVRPEKYEFNYKGLLPTSNCQLVTFNLVERLKKHDYVGLNSINFEWKVLLKPPSLLGAYASQQNLDKDEIFSLY